MTDIIVGDVDWMRNDYICSITIGGVIYPSVEHAYQGSKFTDRFIQREIADAESMREARRIGRERGDIRSNWDDVKLSVMEALLRQKFTTDPILGDRLAKTGSAPIIMKGYDSFWGTGRDGDGDNALGIALEKIRSELQFVIGINAADFDVSDESENNEDNTESTLRSAILNEPSADLAEACQALFTGSVALTSLVDSNDFDAAFISRRTGVSLERAQEAVVQLQAWQSAVNTLKDMLSGEDPLAAPQVSPFYSEDDDDDWDDEDDEDDWLSSNID